MHNLWKSGRFCQPCCEESCLRSSRSTDVHAPAAASRLAVHIVMAGRAASLHASCAYIWAAGM
eukprot:6184247-Pleurochrysis_carterae.AAC.1